MDEFIKELDKNLDYLEHETTADNVVIYVASNRKTCTCPYCGTDSNRIHSSYEKSFQDLPIMGKKTKIVMENRKFFCDNTDCRFTTFAERFDFLSRNGKKTKRLIDRIVDISLDTSSIAAARVLRDGIADVGKSTICSLLKKKICQPRRSRPSPKSALTILHSGREKPMGQSWWISTRTGSLTCCPPAKPLM